MNDTIRELSQQDRTWLQRAEAHILRVLRTKHDDADFDHSENDLRLLQPLIEDGSIRASDVLEAQCVGVALGNVFVEKTPMRWKRVANEYGDMISLHDDSIHFTLYPLTMISKRLEDGREVDLVALYQSLSTDLYAKK